jgi:Family of unknown function (DUF6084)
MDTSARAAPPLAGAIPQLRFDVRSAESHRHAAVPTITFALGVGAGESEQIRSVLLDVQIQIAARRRGYDPDSQGRLLELFGTPDRWSTTLRTLLWARTTVVVPAFEGDTTIDLHLPCSYDLEVTASRYFAALAGGEVPLEFLFTGSVFFSGADGRLQTARIDWQAEAAYDLPVAVWREALDRHFPDSAWVRLGRDTFDRLYAYRGRHAFTDWDSAVETLLDAGEADVPVLDQEPQG